MTEFKNFQPSESKVLATYCTYKTLYEQNKDAYDIVAGFIKYAVEKDGSREYSLIDISDLISKEFGINIPDLVIKTAAKKLDFIEKKNKKYWVTYQEYNIKNNFNDIQNTSLRQAKFVFEQLDQYAKENFLEIQDDKIDENMQKFYASFFKYLIDEHVDDVMATCISKFTLKCEPATRDIIDSMRAGYILYLGLKNNDHLAEIGCWKTPLTLFLDMEILFHIVGYNGIIYERLANELLNLINDVNKKQRYIHLRYFASTKENIERFFSAAENNYKSKEAPLENSTAMEKILDGCKMSSDILDKKTDFFRFLKSKSIIEDDYKDYYTKDLIQYNLEGIDIVDEDEIKSEERLEERIRMISHINKRRRGKFFTDYRDCEYLLLTGTNDTLNIAKKIVDEEAKKDGIHNTVVSYAVNMNTLTNIIWYGLSSKLKTDKTYPSNISSTLKAQIVLSSLLGKSISRLYKDAALQYKNEEISKNDCISRILTYKDKEKLPENINTTNVDDICSFITKKDIKDYKDYNKSLEDKIYEKNNEINKLKDERSLLGKYRIRDLHEMERLKNQESKLESQKKTLQKYKREYYKLKKLIKWGLAILSFIFTALIIVIVYRYGVSFIQDISWVICFILIMLSFVCCKKISVNFMKEKNINIFTEYIAKKLINKRHPEIDKLCLENADNIDEQIKEVREKIKNMLNKSN